MSQSWPSPSARPRSGPRWYSPDGCEIPIHLKQMSAQKWWVSCRSWLFFFSEYRIGMKLEQIAEFVDRLLPYPLPAASIGAPDLSFTKIDPDACIPARHNRTVLVALKDGATHCFTPL